MKKEPEEAKAAESVKKHEVTVAVSMKDAGDALARLVEVHVPNSEEKRLAIKNWRAAK